MKRALQHVGIFLALCAVIASACTGSDQPRGRTHSEDDVAAKRGGTSGHIKQNCDQIAAFIELRTWVSSMCFGAGQDCDQPAGFVDLTIRTLQQADAKAGRQANVVVGVNAIEQGIEALLHALTPRGRQQMVRDLCLDPQRLGSSQRVPWCDHCYDQPGNTAEFRSRLTIGVPKGASLDRRYRKFLSRNNYNATEANGIGPGAIFMGATSVQSPWSCLSSKVIEMGFWNGDNKVGVRAVFGIPPGTYERDANGVERILLPVALTHKYEALIIMPPRGTIDQAVINLDSEDLDPPMYSKGAVGVTVPLLQVRSSVDIAGTSAWSTWVDDAPTIRSGVLVNSQGLKRAIGISNTASLRLEPVKAPEHPPMDPWPCNDERGNWGPSSDVDVLINRPFILALYRQYGGPLEFIAVIRDPAGNVERSRP